MQIFDSTLSSWDSLKIGQMQTFDMFVIFDRLFFNNQIIQDLTHISPNFFFKSKDGRFVLITKRWERSKINFENIWVYIPNRVFGILLNVVLN